MAGEDDDDVNNDNVSDNGDGNDDDCEDSGSDTEK